MIHITASMPQKLRWPNPKPFMAQPETLYGPTAAPPPWQGWGMGHACNSSFMDPIQSSGWGGRPLAALGHVPCTQYAAPWPRLTYTCIILYLLHTIPASSFTSFILYLSLLHTLRLIHVFLLQLIHVFLSFAMAHTFTHTLWRKHSSFDSFHSSFDFVQRLVE